MKNLVLCAAWNIEPDPYKNMKEGSLITFVESWKKYMSDHSEMIMIIEPESSAKKIDYLKKSDIKIRYYSSADFIYTPIHNSRYLKYLDILLEEGDNYNRVFHCDTRDVAFQGNIFDEIKPDNGQHDLFVNEEDPFANLGESFNRKMLINNYSTEIADELSSYKILCSGTTLGSVSMMKIYIKLLIGTRDRQKLQSLGNVISVCGEQGPYNYIFHKNLIPHTKLPNGTGVATMALVNSKNVKILDNGKLSVYDKVPSVIHQWNRFYCKQPLLTDYYSNLYNKKYV